MGYPPSHASSTALDALFGGKPSFPRPYGDYVLQNSDVQFVAAACTANRRSIAVCACIRGKGPFVRHQRIMIESMTPFTHLAERTAS